MDVVVGSARGRKVDQIVQQHSSVLVAAIKFAAIKFARFVLVTARLLKYMRLGYRIIGCI